jgi:hypothetical protein
MISPGGWLLHTRDTQARDRPIGQADNRYH